MQNVLYSSSDTGKEVNSVVVSETHLSTSSEGQSHNSVEQNFMAELSDSEDDDVSEDQYAMQIFFHTNVIKDTLSLVESFMIEQDLDDDPLDTSKFLLSSEGGDSPDLQNVETDAHARLEALLEAAGIGKEGKPFTDPEILRKLTNSVSCALDEAAAALTRMRAENSNQGGQVDGSLAEACSDNDVGTVRRILDEGGSVHETSEEGESLLSLACSAGYYELAQVLLAMRANVEDRGVKGECTPLMEAASAGHVDIVRLLIAHGADVNAQSHTGNTPLMYACAGGHEEVVKELLEAGANVEDHNENGHTPLMEAASAGHVRVAKLLLHHGAGINTHSNEFKESALTLACYKGHLEMVRFLLEAGADQEHKTDEMHTALMEASMDGHVEVARLLLDSGAQVNMPADSFESPLTLAACGGHVELAMLLLERGANIEEVNDEGYTPLMEAAREGHEEMVALLLSQGADINAQTEETQETALTLACCGGFLEVADFLVKAGAGIELGASTPLMEAAQEGHLELVRYLLDAGANVNATTGTGDTALTYACENGHTDVADLLLQAGANLEHESEGGRTPLMKAARAGHLCTVQFLISRGADVNRQTSTNDHTVLSLACAGGHSAVVELLLAHGADPSHKLKDNSTMLIEAAKGGHTNVVQMLLDYPNNLLQSPSDLAQLTPPNPEVAEAPRVPPHGLQVINPQEPLQDPANICYTPNIHSVPRIPGSLNLKDHLSNAQQEQLKQNLQKSLFRNVSMTYPQVVDQAMVTDLQLKNMAEQLNVEVDLSYNFDDNALPVDLDEKDLKPNERLEACINKMMKKAEMLHNTREEQILKKQQILEELQKVERELQEKAQTQLMPNSRLRLEQNNSNSQNLSNRMMDNHSIKNSQQMIFNGQIKEYVQHQNSLEQKDTFSSNPSSPSLSIDNSVTGSDNNENEKLQQDLETLQLESLQNYSVATSAGMMPYEAYLSSPASLSLLTGQTLLQQEGLMVAAPAQTLNETLETLIGPSSQLTNGQHIAVTQHFVPTNTVATQCMENHTLSPSGSLSLPFIPPNPPPASPTITPPLYPSIDLDTQTDSNHDTALTLACAGGHDELVQLLLARGADIEHRDKKGFTPLILAATAGHANVVEILLDHGADIEAQSERTKDTPLSLACSGGRYEVVEILLSRGANKEHRNVSDYTPLSLAASGGYVNIIKLLLSHGAEINSRTGSKLGISPLMLAAMNGHTTAVKLLLDMGSDINAQIETNRNTALTLACFQGRHEVVSLLVDRKANVEHRAKTGLTPLMEAASGGYTEVGRVLLDKGADVNAPPVPSSRDTALTIAADKGHCDFVKLLIERGAIVDVKNKKGNSPLWLAANGGHLDVVQLLVANGADIDSQDNRKVSCLMAAFRKGHVKVVKWMVRHVTQFPSDQECTRYIATINDKELLKKCHQCMELIRAAKDRQAAEANKNATILLEELDMEKTREESKKAAAARRREKKRQKKKEKQLKDNGVKDHVSEKNEPDDDDDKEEILAPIDPPCATTTTTIGKAPSISSDINSSITTSANNNRNIWNTSLHLSKRPSLPNTKNNIKNKLSQPIESVIKVKEKEIVKNKVLVNDKEINERERRPDKKSSREWENAKFYNNTSSTTSSSSSLSTGTVSTSTNLSNQNMVVTVAATTTTSTSTTTSKVNSKNTNSGKRKRDHIQSLNLSGIGDLDVFDMVLSSSKNKSQKSFADSSRVSALDTFTEDILLGLLDLPNSNNAVSRAPIVTKMRSLGTPANNIKSPPSNITSPKRGGPSSSGHKREDGWKEVVRRSKKVLVPSSAISRVIGRGGSNINTIREVSGAHIEVEKQKGTGDRTITIKGSADATRHANQLITALIKDVNQDLTELIPKNEHHKTNSSYTVTSSNLSHSSRSSKSNKNSSSTQSTNNSSSHALNLSCRITCPIEPFPIATQTWSSSVINTTIASPTKILSCSSISASNIVNSTSTVPSGRQLSPAESRVSLQTTTNITKTSVTYTSAVQAVPQIKTATTNATFASKIIENKATSPSSPKKISATPIAVLSRTVPPKTNNSVPRTASPQISKLPSQITQIGPPLPSPVTGNVQENSQGPISTQNQLQNQQRKCFSAPPIGAPAEYLPFSNLFSEVTQSVWGQKDKSKDEAENRMDFATVAANNVSVLSTSVMGNTKPDPVPLIPPPDPEIDISAKAPGYRGNCHISPIGISSQQSSMLVYSPGVPRFNNTSPSMGLHTNPSQSSVVSSLQSSLNPNAPDFTSRSNYLPPSQPSPIFNHSMTFGDNQSAFSPMYDPHSALMQHAPPPPSQSSLTFAPQQPNPSVSEYTNIGMMVNSGNFSPGNTSVVNASGLSINPRRFSPLSVHPAPRSTSTTPSVGASSKDEGSPVPTMSPVPSPRSSNTSSPVGIPPEQPIKPIGEDRKLPRPIGTERAHRKAPVYAGLSEAGGIWSFSSSQGAVPCFIREKNINNDWIQAVMPPSKDESQPTVLSGFIEAGRPLENHIEPHYQPSIIAPVGSLYPQFANGIPPQIPLSHIYNNTTMSHLVTSDWNSRLKISSNDTLQDNKMVWNSWPHPPM